MSDRQFKKFPGHFDPADPAFDLFSSPFYLIAHADHTYHDGLDKAIAKHGVDRTRYRILTIMMRTSRINIRDLSRLGMLKRSTASRALERMRQEQWVTLTLDENDNRHTNVELTKAGRELAKKVMLLGSRQWQRSVEGLDQEQLEQLVSLLQHLVGNLSKLPIE
jgi:DNA-binding MarR family transcriptional regulator